MPYLELFHWVFISFLSHSPYRSCFQIIEILYIHHCTLHQTWGIWSGEERARSVKRASSRGRLLTWHKIHDSFITNKFHFCTRIYYKGLDKSWYQVDIYLISPQKHMLWALIRGASNEYHNIYFRGEIRKKYVVGMKRRTSRREARKRDNSHFLCYVLISPEAEILCRP